MSSNFLADITADGEMQFKRAMTLFEYKYSAITGYRICPTRGMIFYWSAPTDREVVSGYTAFPFKMSVMDAGNFALAWLKQVDYGPEPDLDGSCKKGWRVYNETYGYVDRDPYAFMAVQPVWTEYHK